MHHDSIAVVDFGGQYAHLMATKVRRQKVLAEILQPEDPISKFKQHKGIILSGNPSLSSFGEDSDYNKEIFDLDIPILGFCFGHQEIAKHYGGNVMNGKQEFGRAQLKINRDHPLFKGLSSSEQVWMSHNDTVTSVGPDFEELGFSILGEGTEPHHFAAIGSDKYRRYGFQFHPEVDDTTHGDEMIRNFAVEICGCSASWEMEQYLEEEIEKIKSRVGSGSVFLLASGGVDSTVAARLFGEALRPEQLHLLHVDNGLMRKNESEQVLKAFKDMGLDANLHFVDATSDFLSALEGLVEPEQKRKAIGDTFVKVFEREAQRLGLSNHLLGQGTIYPDTIETGGTKRSDTIKTHHNRVQIIEDMIAAGKVIEPLADLYKVEVRELGEKLKIPSEMIWRQPFPGPGLGVRLLCSTGTLNDAALIPEIADEVAAVLVNTSFVGTVLPVKSVGVKGDLRSYEHPVMIHGTADWNKLDEIAGTVLKKVRGINRCIWNLSPSMPTEFRPLAATMTKDRLDLLRDADHIVMEGLRRHGLETEVWQCPTVLLPLEIDGHGEELCIVRPIHSERAMTATAAHLPIELIEEIRKEVLALPKISGLAYDLTSKPPGTIEWE